MWYNSKFFRYSLSTLIILLIIFMLGQINFFLNPFKQFIAILFFPFLISGLLYYLLRPLVNLVGKLRIPRTAAIIIIFAVLAGLLVLISSYAGSIVAKELNQLANDIPHYAEIARKVMEDAINNLNFEFLPIDKLSQQLTDFLQKLIPFLSRSVFSGLSAVANVTTILIIVPFILFYTLKDDRLFYSGIIGTVPKQYKTHGREILHDIDKTLSSYITGQAIIALVIGVLMYIGYLILGVKYAFILALFAMLTAIIPILGAFIGVLPALLVGLADGPFMIIKILLLMTLVQQLEGNLISPNIMGKRMNIHPLTFIILLLAAASLYGFVGMLIAVPTYAVSKVVIKNLYKVYKLRKA